MSQEPRSGWLDVRGLTVASSGRAGYRTLLQRVSLRVGRGEIVGIVGETGAGKTILIRALMGALPAGVTVTAGTVMFRGAPLDLQERSGIQSRPGMSVILSDGRRQLNPLAPVQQQIVDAVLAHANIGRAAALDRGRELLSMVQLANLRERLRAYPHELSGGMAQRVFIAMALASSPELLFADEPTFGLDVTVQKQILDLIAALVRYRSMTLLLVTRDLGIVAHYADRVAVIRDGETVEVNDTIEFFRAPENPYSRQLIDSAVAAL